jgi:hypothetical protein
MLQAYSGGAHSNLDRDTAAILTEVFVVFFGASKKILGQYLDYDRFLPNPFQVIIQ